jgi:hypothetical protein
VEGKKKRMKEGTMMSKQALRMVTDDGRRITGRSRMTS